MVLAMKYFFSFLTFIVFIFISSCELTNKEIVGSGNISAETRDVKDFNRIIFNGSGNLFISLSDKNSVKLEGEDNILPFITTEVNENTLQINFKDTKKNFKATKPINIFVTTKKIQEIHLSGSGTISSQHLNFDDLKFSISGSGSVDASVSGKKLISVLSGTGNFDIKGSVDSQEVWINGSGIYNGLGLSSAVANIKVSGSGKVYVNAKDNLDVRISGAGTVYYLGDPTINQSISGSGKIEKSK